MEVERTEAKYLITGAEANWDVERFDVSLDGKFIAYVKNEDGLSRIHVRRTANNTEVPLPKLPVGVVGSLRWHKNGHELGFSLSNARGSGDVYSLDVATGKVERWTVSESAVKTDEFPEAELVRWRSYGGHMTLAVSTFYSDRIRCSVDIVGMSNLVTFLEHTEAYRRDLRRVEYGDERDPKMREFLEKIAPMNNIEKIKKPMFVIAGKNDPRVPVSESQQIADALKKQGTPVWLLIAKDEGHGYRKKPNQDFQFYATVEFLQENLLK